MPYRVGFLDDGDDWYENDQRTLTVFEQERQPVDTGLVDAHGRTIWRVPEDRVIGFVGSGRKRRRGRSAR